MYYGALAQWDTCFAAVLALFGPQKGARTGFGLRKPAKNASKHCYEVIMAILATPVQLYCGCRFHLGAYHALSQLECGLGW